MKKTLKCCVPLLCVLTVNDIAHAAATWRVVRMDGTVFFSDTPNHRGYRMITKSWKAWAEKSDISVADRKKKFDPIISKAAQKHGLNPSLIHAIILTESGYRPEVVSRAGATGLMQLMPETAKRFGVKNITDPKENIDGGCAYLKTLLAMFNNDLSLALAAYNAGENAVKKYDNSIPPYPETQQYVKKIFASYDQKKDGSPIVVVKQNQTTPLVAKKTEIKKPAKIIASRIQNIEELLIKELPQSDAIKHGHKVLDKPVSKTKLIFNKDVSTRDQLITDLPSPG